MIFYNEFDPKAAAWLRESQAQGDIPKGVVDERSIVDVNAADLIGFRQVHLFAGIGGWAFALSLAGIDPDESFWTISCPCPPFSCAGKKKACPACGGTHPIPCPRRTGYFICRDCEHAWFADERHLWPEAFRLIRDQPRESRPAIIVGEQVAGADGIIWFAGVRASLERIGYAVGAADLAAASIGAPHIRQRLFWVACDCGVGDSNSGRSKAGRQATAPAGYGSSIVADGGADRLEHAPGDGRQQRWSESSGRRATGGCGDGVERMADSEQPGLEGFAGDGNGGSEPRRVGAFTGGPTPTGGRSRGLAEPDDAERRSDLAGRNERDGTEAGREQGNGESGECREVGGVADPGSQPEGRRIQRSREGACSDDGRPSNQPGGSSNAGPWSDYAIIPCRDGKARRIPRSTQSGVLPLDHGVPDLVAAGWSESDARAIAEAQKGFPLAKGIKGRVGLLRGAGNAIVPYLAAEFIRAAKSAINDL